MRLDNVQTLTVGRYPIRLMSRPPRLFGPPEPPDSVLRSVNIDTWELSALQLRYRPTDWPVTWDMPYGTVNGWELQLRQSGPPPTCNGTNRLFLSDVRIDELARDDSWVLMPNIGPLYGHIEIHATNLTPRWLLRYPTVNGGEAVELKPILSSWRHPQEPW